MRNSSVAAVAFYLLIAILLAVSCGHGKHTANVGTDCDSSASGDGIATSLNDSAGSNKTTDPNLLAMLRDELMRQLTELHGDYSKMTLSAPDGDSGRVTDLAYDTGTHMLQWTYVNLADYDSNGEVGVPDITPIANNYLAVTTDGEGNDALERWIDGDFSGDVGVPDITPIANNYLARVDGYRVYRKDPGEIQYKRLPNPGDPSSFITVGFETGSDAVPPAFTFEDKPPVTGIYEYYVVAYAKGSGESQTQSNHVIFETDGYSDTSAPVWDDTSGITSATDNGDQTVTVTFGMATDIAVPPAPATPPVTYSVYYSTVTPMDFSTATKVTGLTESPWVSPELSGGTTYYFAVRAVDGASPKNEDANTAELPVAVAGEPVEDHDPPVWVDESNTYDGLEKVLVQDGKLKITRADAVDALSPPVHYDLYYLSNRISQYIIDFPTNHNFDMHPETQVIRDIPKEFEFPWENRHGVILLVRARDSAEPANETTNLEEFTTAPTNLLPRTLELELPWMDDSNLRGTDSSQTFDPETHSLFTAYIPQLDDSGLTSDTPGFYFVSLNTDSLNYSVQEILPIPTDGADYHSPNIRLSWTGELWASIYLSYGYGSGYTRYFHSQPGSAWQEWYADDIPDGWNGSFDHNGNPAFFWGEYSDVAYNRTAVYYKWWDKDERDWIYEFICDPGGEGITHVRPDGVVQVVMERDTDTVFGGSDGVIYGRILERSTDGVWNEVYSVEGSLWNQADPYDTWDSEWAWGASVLHANETVEQIVYGQNGYEVLPGLKINNEYIYSNGKAWPTNGSFHSLPTYLTYNNKTNALWCNSREYSADTEWSTSKTYRVMDTMYYYPVDGYGFVIYRGPDFDTNRGVLRIWTTPPGVSILDP